MNTEDEINVITMPAIFEQKVFEVKELGNFLSSLFSESDETEESFLDKMSEKARELSDDYEDVKWVLAKEIDPDHHTFFVFPNDASKQYTIELPDLNDPSSDFDYSDNLTRVVDNKLFGLVVYLSVCSDWWSNDDDLNNMYMDLGQDLNVSIVYAHKAICDDNILASAPSSEYGQMISVVKEYLSPRHDEMEDHYDDYALGEDYENLYDDE